MNTSVPSTNLWIGPHVGSDTDQPGLDSEMFDRTTYPYTETFVREAIQNTLDARLDHSKPAIINFRSMRTGSAASCTACQRDGFPQQGRLDVPDEWKAGANTLARCRGFQHKGTERRAGQPHQRFLELLAQFRGIEQGRLRTRRTRDRAVTFLISSRLQSVIGYTRRSADKSEAICGMAVLRAREDGKKFLSTHAYLAHAERDSIYDLHEEPQFRRPSAMRLALQDTAVSTPAGWPLPIPYPHQELEPEGILAAAIENFAPAIMSGALVLGVNGRVLDPGSIGEIAAELSARFNDSAVQGRCQSLSPDDQIGLEADPFRSLHLPNAQKGDLEALHSQRTARRYKKVESDDDVVLELTFPLERKGKDETVTLTAVLARTPQGMKPMDRLFREGMSLPDVRAGTPAILTLLSWSRTSVCDLPNFCEGKRIWTCLRVERNRQNSGTTGLANRQRLCAHGGCSRTFPQTCGSCSHRIWPNRMPACSTPFSQNERPSRKTTEAVVNPHLRNRRRRQSQNFQGRDPGRWPPDQRQP